MPTLTTPTRQKAAAVAAVTGKAKAKKPDVKKSTAAPKAAAKAPSRWRDTHGVELIKGLTVMDNAGSVLGTVAYRHTHNIDGKPVGMVGVALTGKGDAAKVGGRTVRNRSFRADELTAVPE
jgi:hypothetical protein